MAGTSIHKVLMRAIKGTQKPQLRQQKQQDVSHFDRSDQTEENTISRKQVGTANGFASGKKLKTQRSEIHGALKDFSLHTHNDRWAQNHPDTMARDQPKDGATVISNTGNVLKVIRLWGFDENITRTNVTRGGGVMWVGQN